MTIGRLTTRLGSSLLGACLGVSAAWGAENPKPAMVAEHHSPPQHDQAGDLVRIVRDVTRRFRDASVAQAEGYNEMFGCVSGSDEGAMGVHLVNFPLVGHIVDGKLIGDAVLDAYRPEIVVYEPMPNGQLRLVAADYLVLKDAWDAAHPGSPPELKGQLFHLFDAPNRFGLPAFYTLHVWAWKDNPHGTYVNWNPQVSCDSFTKPE